MEEELEEVYLVNPDGTSPRKTESTWVKIGEDNSLEYINWFTIENFAKEFDYLGPHGTITETHVICKLLTLVRDETRKQAEREYAAHKD